MSIPAFTIDGVIPPYIGANGPGGVRGQMTPYEASPLEVVTRFATTDRRREILGHWLEHRQMMRALGIDTGFQWLDGSFVEDKEPNDLDIVTFFRRPLSAQTAVEVTQLMQANPETFRRPAIRTARRLDAMFVDLNGSSEGIIDATRYWCGLFSHRRVDNLWKGMVKVPLNAPDEDLAVLFLEAEAGGDGHQVAHIMVDGGAR